MDLKGTLFGKKLFVYDPGIQCEESDVETLLKEVNCLEALRKIVDYSCKFVPTEKEIIEIEGVPITEDLLIDAAIRIIKYSNPAGEKELTGIGIQLLLKMCFSLFQKELVALKGKPYEILLKISYRQFTFQDRQFNLLARSLFFYMELWNSVDEAKQFDVLKEIEAIIGVPYDVAIAFAISLVANKHGYFFMYQDNVIKQFSFALGKPIPSDAQRKFLNWCSAGYDFYKKDADNINPFVKCPIIDSQTKPKPNLNNVFLIVSYSSLYKKITSGMYFSLIDAFNKGGKNNEFKEKFGYVFEKYIGTLLRNHLDGWEVSPEIKYFKGANTIASADWLIHKNGKLILVEAKQSSIFLKSKSSANLEDVKKDLRKTLVKAATQLQTTHDDIKSGSFSELSNYFKVTEIQCLIVISDPLYHANHIGRELISDEVKGLSIDYNIINISDFETLLDNQSSSNSLFDLLVYKKLAYKNFDFKEFMIEMLPTGYGEMKFLRKYFNEYFSRFDDYEGSAKGQDKEAKDAPSILMTQYDRATRTQPGTRGHASALRVRKWPGTAARQFARRFELALTLLPVTPGSHLQKR